MYLDDDKVYRLILKDANDVTYFDKDRVSSIGGGDYKVLTFNTIADLRLKIGSEKEPVAQTSGYYNAGDGGGNSFYWDGTSSAVDNGGTIIKPTFVSGAGRWLAVNPKDIRVGQWGAIGNGVADDTSILNACFAANVGGRVELDKGKTYYTTATLYIACSVIGNGAVILGKIDVAANNITLKDFTITSPSAVFALYLHGSLATTYTNIVIDNIKIDFGASATPINSRVNINATYIRDLVVKNCNLKYGLQLIRCTNYLIKDNKLDGDNYQNNNELIHASVRSTGIITNNLFVDSLDNFIDVYSSGEKTIISNNRMLGCKLRTGAGIEIKVTLADDPNNTSGGVNDYGFDEQIIITGNYIGGLVAPSVIACQAVTIFYIDTRAVPSFSWANAPRNFIITNNIFDGFDNTLHGGGLFAGVYLDTVTSAVVSNNIFRNLGVGGSSDDNSASVLIIGCTDVKVTQNKMAFKNGTGVGIHGTCTNLDVSHNSVTDDLNAVYSNSYGIRMQKSGSLATPVVSNCTFVGNTLNATIASFRQFAASGGTLQYSIISNNIANNESVFQSPTKCLFVSNSFSVSSTRYVAFQLGDASLISAFNTVKNNQVLTPVSTPKNGLLFSRTRASIISGNIINTSTYGIQFVGTGVGGELDNLIVKDNISISQTQINFPQYSSMAAADTALLNAATNIKTT